MVGGSVGDGVKVGNGVSVLVGDGVAVGVAVTVDVGVARLQVDPGKQASAVHVHYAQEEIFYVLGGSGISWQDGKAYDIGPGDCIVHLAGKETHTLIAGQDGLDVLAYGERLSPMLTRLPRSGIFVAPGVMLDASLSGHVWEREPEDLEVPEPSPRTKAGV